MRLIFLERLQLLITRTKTILSSNGFFLLKWPIRWDGNLHASDFLDCQAYSEPHLSLNHFFMNDRQRNYSTGNFVEVNFLSLFIYRLKIKLSSMCSDYVFLFLVSTTEYLNIGCFYHHRKYNSNGENKY